MAFSLEKTDLGIVSKMCETHGNYESRGERINLGRGLEHWTSCPGCKLDAEVRKQELHDAKVSEEAKARIERMMMQSAIPQRFVGRTFQNWRASTPEQEKAFKICLGFATNFESHLADGTSLVFSGAAGTGKSHLAAAILQEIMPRHVGVYTTFMGMIRLIRETWRHDSTRSESQVLQELGSLPLLVIDEIGVQYGTEAEHTLLFEVMDRRYRDQKPSILMTNQDKDGFRKFVGDRVYDRMTETARWVSFSWESYRAKARTEVY